LRIAVAGKGGSGKTTFAALVVRELVNTGNVPVLAVDADANANLAEVLGIEVEETVADVLTELKDDQPSLPGGMSKAEYLDFRLHQVLAESPGVDLLVMGKPEGPGCYCYVNNLLQSFMERKARDYPFLLLDNEAGLEHLSRRTTRKVDFLFVVSDATVRGIHSAKRINWLVKSLDLSIEKILLVVNRLRDGTLSALKAPIATTGLEVAGYVPQDEAVEAWDLEGRPLVTLPDDAPAVAAVREIVHRFVLGRSRAPSKSSAA
jgi:CO dehydrogenase maturation factor